MVSTEEAEKHPKRAPSLQADVKVTDVHSGAEVQDVFGDERNHDIAYKTLSWQVSTCRIHTIFAAYSSRPSHLIACQRVDDSGDRQ